MAAQHCWNNTFGEPMRVTISPVLSLGFSPTIPEICFILLLQWLHLSATLQKKKMVHFKLLSPPPFQTKGKTASSSSIARHSILDRYLTIIIPAQQYSQHLKAFKGPPELQSRAKSLIKIILKKINKLMCPTSVGIETGSIRIKCNCLNISIHCQIANPFFRFS